MLNRECWNFVTSSSKSFVALTSMKSLKRTPTLSPWLWRGKLGGRLSPQKGRQVECNACERLHKHFHCPRSRQTCFPECTSTHQNNNKREPGLFKENLDVKKGSCSKRYLCSIADYHSVSWYIIQHTKFLLKTWKLSEVNQNRARNSKTSSAKQNWKLLHRKTPENSRLVWRTLLGFGLKSAHYSLS